MKFFLPILICGLAVWLPPAASRADESSHRAAVGRLFAVMNMEKNHAATLDRIIDTQSAAAPPAVKGALKEFFTKHMNWAAIREDMVKLYAETFTEEEVSQLAAFYESPVGRKSMEQVPALTGKAMNIAQEKMKPHLPELEAAIRGMTGGPAAGGGKGK